MRVLSVDLAARYSGFAILEDEELIWSYALDVGPEADGFRNNSLRLATFVDSLATSINSLAAGKASAFKQLYKKDIDLIVCEDLSHSMVKPGPALRLQGVLRYLCYDLFPNAEVEMVMPSSWQSFYGWKKTPGITSKGFATYACKVLGYDIETELKGKQVTDIRDAVLIARYGYEKFGADALNELVTVESGL